jgi:hypothetical protein
MLNLGPTWVHRVAVRVSEWDLKFTRWDEQECVSCTNKGDGE